MMRVALISTPRSGNTWLRYLMSRAYDLKQCAAHEPGTLEFFEPNQAGILQIHWRRSDDFCRLLTDRGFKVLTIARHPLDVLLSILHFSGKEPQTDSWLLGAGGDESAIRGCSPQSAAFLSYAVSLRAKCLIAVTCDWWSHQDVIRLRYEDLVLDPIGALTAACSSLGSTQKSLPDVVAEFTLDQLRPTSLNDHFWQGTPDLWQYLLPDEMSSPILHAHADSLAELGYSMSRSISTSAAEANELWERLR